MGRSERPRRIPPLSPFPHGARRDGRSGGSAEVRGPDRVGADGYRGGRGRLAKGRDIVLRRTNAGAADLEAARLVCPTMVDVNVISGQQTAEGRYVKGDGDFIVRSALAGITVAATEDT